MAVNAARSISEKDEKTEQVSKHVETPGLNPNTECPTCPALLIVVDNINEGLGQMEGSIKSLEQTAQDIKHTQSRLDHKLAVMLSVFSFLGSTVATVAISIITEIFKK